VGYHQLGVWSNVFDPGLSATVARLGRFFITQWQKIVDLAWIENGETDAKVASWRSRSSRASSSKGCAASTVD
jgi:hypothetical protein